MSKMDQYLNRTNMALNNQQFLTTHDWEFEIAAWGAALYQPAENTYFCRAESISGVQPMPQFENAVLEVNIRGFYYLQPGLVNTKPADLTINFQDFEDQTIRVWIWDWLNKMNSLTTLASYRREDLFCDINVYQLNSSRQRVFKYAYQNCLPSGVTEDVTLDSGKEALGKIPLVLSAEFMLPTPLNVPGAIG